MELNFSFGNWDATTILLFCFTFLCAYWLSQTLLRRNYPPGPFAWPVLGHIPKLVNGKSRTDFFDQVANRYGPVTTIWLGAQPLVLLNSHEAIREALVANADLFHNRPFPFIAQKVLEGKRVGIILNNGESHKVMRRVTMVALHDFGLGKQSLEEKIQQETVALSDELQKLSGQPIKNIRKTIQLAIVNIINSVVFGDRLPYGGKESLELMKQLDVFFRTNLFFQPDNFFPFLKYLPMNHTTRGILSAQNAFKDHVRKQVDKHRTTFDPKNIRDFIDLYLKAENENEEYFNADNLFRVTMDLFAAGSETTATTLTWVLLFLVTDPKTQDTARQEIFKVLGQHKMPVAKDRDDIIYIDALLHEVMRYATIAPLGIPRILLENAKVCGHVIPKGCLIIPNIYRVHMDEGYWKDPKVFRPERWIDEGGRLIKHGHFMPFSIGKRACLGESFAKIEVFIIITMLLQRFKFSLPSGSTPPALEVVTGITRAPPQFEILAVPI